MKTHFSLMCLQRDMLSAFRYPFVFISILVIAQNCVAVQPGQVRLNVWRGNPYNNIHPCGPDNDFVMFSTQLKDHYHRW